MKKIIKKAEYLKVNGKFELLQLDDYLEEEFDSKNWERIFSTNEFESDKAKKFIKNIYENRLTGSDAESEYLLVTIVSNDDGKFTTNEHKALKRDVAIKIENVNDGISGLFLGNGDPDRGIFDFTIMEFTEV